MTARQLQARCLCGGVRIDATFPDGAITACHCDTCRRWTSGPFMAVTGARDVTYACEDYLGLYRSSGWGERGFCKNCGSTLFWRSLDGVHLGLSATAIGDLESPHLAAEIFIDSKPGWYAFSNETQTMTGGEVLAQMTPDED